MRPFSRRKESVNLLLRRFLSSIPWQSLVLGHSSAKHLGAVVIDLRHQSALAPQEPHGSLVIHNSWWTVITR